MIDNREYDYAGDEDEDYELTPGERAGLIGAFAIGLTMLAGTIGIIIHGIKHHCFGDPKNWR